MELMRLFFGLMFLMPFGAFSQVDFGTAKSFNLQLDNDVFFGTDDYYSNGILLGYHAPKILSLFNSKYPTQQGLQLSHKIFTPSRFNKETIDFDRPFVSSLSLDFYSSSLRTEQKLRLSHQLELGIQGRNSGGRTVQNFIHRILPASKEVEDWQYQMDTDVIINYSLSLEKGVAQGNYWMINVIGTATAGTPRLGADVGANLRLGKQFDRFKYEDLALNDWALFLYTKPMIHLTAYDTYLQGGLFTNDHPFALDEINHLSYSIESGIYFTKGQIALNFGFTYQSPLAENLTHHRWMSLGLTYAIN